MSNAIRSVLALAGNRVEGFHVAAVDTAAALSSLLLGGNPSTLIDTRDALKASPLRTAIQSLIDQYSAIRADNVDMWSEKITGRKGGKWVNAPKVAAATILPILKSAMIGDKAHAYHVQVGMVRHLELLDVQEVSRDSVKKARASALRAGWLAEELDTMPPASPADVGKACEMFLFNREWCEAIAEDGMFNANRVNAETIAAPTIQPTIDLIQHEKIVGEVTEHNKVLHGQLQALRADLSRESGRADTASGKLQALLDMVQAGKALKDIRAFAATL